MSHSDTEKPSASCIWRLDENAWHTYWQPSCGDHPFEFNEGGPVENGFKYCPYCSAKIIEEQREKETEA